MRPLPSMDINDPTVKESAAKSDDRPTMTGEYEVTIVQASIEEAANGSAFITLAYQMPNGKVYRQDPKQIRKSEADGFEDGYFVPQLRALFAITGARDTIGTAEIKGGDFVEGKFVEKTEQVPSYVDLIGKKVGSIMFYYRKYPESLGINGYTGRTIRSRQVDPEGYEADKKDPTTIWMPDTSKEDKPVFEFVKFFDPATRKTFSEMQDDTCETPTIVDEMLKKYLEKPSTAVILPPKEWDDERIKRLKRNLAKAGLEYDSRLFIPTAANAGASASSGFQV